MVKLLNIQYQWLNSKIIDVSKTDFIHFLIFRCLPSMQIEPINKCPGLSACVGTVQAYNLSWRLKRCTCVYSHSLPACIEPLKGHLEHVFLVRVHGQPAALLPDVGYTGGQSTLSLFLTAFPPALHTQTDLHHGQMT